MKNDLNLISGKFFHKNIDKDYIYLKKYFKTKYQKIFLTYYILFKNTSRFKEHTGINIKNRYLRVLKKRFKDLTIAYVEAFNNFELDKIGIINTGNYFKYKKRIFRDVIKIY
jgi:hypothetical protein